MDEKKDEEICWGPVIGILYENEKKIRDEYAQKGKQNMRSADFPRQYENMRKWSDSAELFYFAPFASLISLVKTFTKNCFAEQGHQNRAALISYKFFA